MFLKTHKRTLSFLLALILVLSTFMSVAVFPASAAGDNYGVKLSGSDSEEGFATLKAAIDYVIANATESGSVITVLQDVTYGNDDDNNLTIPSGTTLLVPCDAAHTVNTVDLANSVINVQTVYSYETPSNFCTMTMAAGSQLTVADGGAICVNSKLASIGSVSDDSNNWNGAPTGPNGRICMNSNSKITLSSGSNLYTWGYIYEDDSNVAVADKGKVEALDGSTVYEAFQIKNYRGLRESMAAVQNGGVFPFNQYYVQNIEAPLYAYPGANEVGVAALHNTGSGIYPCPVSFIGETGLFRLSKEDEDAYLIKDYDEENDRLNVQIYGDSELSAVTLSLYGITLDSSSFPLPITNNVTVEIVEGSTEINQNISMLPGTELVVDQDATVTIAENTSVYIYDAYDWSNAYVGTGDEDPGFVGVGYTVANGDTTNDIREAEDIPSAKVDINGTVEVNGGFYATSYADVSSSEGTGKVIINTTASPESSLNECDAEGTPEEVGFCSVQLRVGEDEYGDPIYFDTYDPETNGYTEGVIAYDSTSEDGYTYEAWYTVKWYDFPGEYDDNGDPTNEPFLTVVCKSGDQPVFDHEDPWIYQNTETDQYTLSNFIGWATEPNSIEATVEVTDGNKFPAVTDSNVNYYAAYAGVEKSYTVKWYDLSGNVLYTSPELVPYSQVDADDCSDIPEPINVAVSGSYESEAVGASLSTDKMKKTATAFKSWSSPAFDSTTGICTFTPISQSSAQYLVLFMNEDQSAALSEQYYAANTMIDPCEVYSGETPTKADDENYSYTFSGWQAFDRNGDPGTKYLVGENKKLSVGDLTTGASTTKKTKANAQTFVPVFEETPINTTKHSLTLDGTIGVNFYVTLPDGDNPADYTMDFSWGNKYVSTNTYSDQPYTETGVTCTAETVDGKTMYKFTLHVAPKELNDEITATLKKNGIEVSTEFYKGTDYAYEILGKESLSGYTETQLTKLKTLVTDMLNYCAAAQVNFNYHTDALANSGLTSAQQELANVDLETLKNNSINEPDGLSYFGSSMNLGSETSYMLIFQNDNDLTPAVSAKYTGTDTTLETELKKSGVALGINVLNLPAAKVTSDIDLTINGQTSTVNAGAYIGVVLGGGSTDSNLQNVMKALYRYNQSAVAFFGE